MTAAEFILNVTNKNLICSFQDGKFQSGHNGPYDDPETPVRNSAHWLITLAKCYELDEKEIYLDHIQKLAEYLCSPEARPHGFSFFHRKKGKKDRCNGLIGQAWTFEALAKASEILNDPKYINLAREVFCLHTYDKNNTLWHKLEIDGTKLALDPTFNHQLWFAACSALLDKHDQYGIYPKIRHFLDSLSLNLDVLKTGLIYHPLPLHRLKNISLRKKITRSLKKCIKPLSEELIYKSIGYHAFNMYGFALLKGVFPDHSFWQSPVFQVCYDYMNSQQYIEQLVDNRFGYPYNPCGFENAFTLSVFQDDNTSREKIAWWVKQQINKTYNNKTKMFDKNTADPATLTARIYELTRLPDEVLTNLHINGYNE
ncbi:MAG: hypothetical protein ACLFPX_02505 [Candidatus Omnitrophota bacterium]